MPIEIVVVDDSPSDRLLVERSLRSHQGVQVDSFVSATSARERLVDRVVSGEITLPRLVLLDIRMPGMDGFALLQQLRSRPVTRRLPVVMLSTSASRPDVQRAYELGANGYLVKPNRLPDLERHIASVVRYWTDTMLTPDQV